MNFDLVDKVVNAVLYEGYMLYPYRPSAVKNRQRWTFGGIYPQAYSLAQGGAEPSAMQAECLVVGDRHSILDIRIRFLQLLAREVGALDAPAHDLPDGAAPAFHVVPELQVGERLFQTWQEAVERDIGIAGLRLSELSDRPHRQAFGFPAWRELELLRDPGGVTAGVIVREQQSIEGLVELAATPVADGVFKITVRVLNHTPLDAPGARSRDMALMRSLASTHIILGVRQGELVSLLDPPGDLREAAGECDNIGCWPVLVGAEGQREMMLASPIILYDYPQIAPESPGDLFDGTEIDEILTLRIMTMTEAEKREMSAVDERARALLDRTEALGREELMRMHGTLRGLRPAEES